MLWHVLTYYEYFTIYIIFHNPIATGSHIAAAKIRKYCVQTTDRTNKTKQNQQIYSSGQVRSRTRKTAFPILHPHDPILHPHHHQSQSTSLIQLLNYVPKYI